MRPFYIKVNDNSQMYFDNHDFELYVDGKYRVIEVFVKGEPENVVLRYSLGVGDTLMICYG